MSASSDLQAAIAELLAQPGALRLDVPIVARREKDLAAEIEAAAAKQSALCIYIMPPLPTRAMQGADFVFFEAAEVRVRIIEQPQSNGTGVDAYDLIDDIATALHWAPHEAGTKLGAILGHPLQLASRPVQMIEDPKTRIIDVIFEATYGFAPRGGDFVFTPGPTMDSDAITFDRT